MLLKRCVGSTQIKTWKGDGKSSLKKALETEGIDDKALELSTERVVGTSAKNEDETQVAFEDALKLEPSDDCYN